jgi:hypothetical protein
MDVTAMQCARKTVAQPEHSQPMHRRSANTISLVACLGCLLAAPFLNGCRDRGPQRTVVSGAVTFKGKPVANGKIWFVPNQASNAPTTVASIVDGNYVANGRGGVPVGVQKVQIEAYQSVSPQTAPAGPRPPTANLPRLGPQFLPAKYNTNSQLTLTIEPGVATVTKNFDLTD